MPGFTKKIFLKNYKKKLEAVWKKIVLSEPCAAVQLLVGVAPAVVAAAVLSPAVPAASDPRSPPCPRIHLSDDSGTQKPGHHSGCTRCVSRGCGRLFPRSPCCRRHVGRRRPACGHRRVPSPSRFHFWRAGWRFSRPHSKA